jgi:hypothetical protein
LRGPGTAEQPMWMHSGRSIEVRQAADDRDHARQVMAALCHLGGTALVILSNEIQAAPLLAGIVADCPLRFFSSRF